MSNVTVNVQIINQIAAAFDDALTDASLAAAYSAPARLDTDGMMVEAHHQACHAITALLADDRMTAERHRAAFEDVILDVKRRVIYVGNNYDRAESPVSNDRITAHCERWEEILTDLPNSVPMTHMEAAHVLRRQVCETPA